MNGTEASTLQKIKLICDKIVQKFKNQDMDAVEDEDGFLSFEFENNLFLTIAELNELYLSTRSSSSMVRKLGIAAMALTLKKEPNYLDFLQEIEAVRMFKGFVILNNFDFTAQPYLENYFSPFEPTKDLANTHLLYSLKFKQLNSMPFKLNENRVIELIDNNEIGWIPDP
jgi:hypothetical protein